ncbi:MAG TPA: ATP-binding protein [Gemmatimonadaceae bacterium]|nr:ATP-binding protein [Gemmatimonadaceae bacterium]
MHAGRDPSTSALRPRSTAAAARALAQQALREIVERLADGIVIVDAEGTIRFVNPAAEQLFGRPTAELIGEDFGHPLVPGASTEIEVVHRAGSTTVAEVRVVEIEWDGVPARLISLRDITDRREADARARELAREQTARLEAEAASQAKSDFLATMSHELRTPLNAILGYAELLDLGISGSLSAQQRQQLRRITVSGKHLLGLVNEVLDLARVEAGRLNVRHEPFDVGRVLEAALVVVAPLAEERGLTLRAPGDAARGIRPVGDEDRVRQVVVNLLSNAIKFTEPGGSVALGVEETDSPDGAAHVRGGGSWVAISVTDTGIGIAREQLDTIFAPFVQAQGGHTRDHDGSGLGLTISRRLARLMGGDLTVKSAVGKGSTFVLWLPATGAASSEPESELTGREPHVSGFTEVGESILREADAIVDEFVARLRAEPSMPTAKSLRYTQLADHATTFIADVAGALTILEEAGGAPSPLLADAADIQRYIAERHGIQRARLGWTREALSKEFEVLREEIDCAVARNYPGARSSRVTEALAVVRRQIEQAAQSSFRALERTLAEEAERG